MTSRQSARQVIATQRSRGDLFWPTGGWAQGDTFREGAAHTNCMLRGMEPNEIRDIAVEVRENAETLVDGEVDALNDAKYLAAQVASLAHAVEELAKKIGNV